MVHLEPGELGHIEKKEDKSPKHKHLLWVVCFFSCFFSIWWWRRHLWLLLQVCPICRWHAAPLHALRHRQHLPSEHPNLGELPEGPLEFPLWDLGRKEREKKGTAKKSVASFVTCNLLQWFLSYKTESQLKQMFAILVDEFLCFLLTEVERLISWLIFNTSTLKVHKNDLLS